MADVNEAGTGIIDKFDLTEALGLHLKLFGTKMVYRVESVDDDGALCSSMIMIMPSSYLRGISER